MGSAPPVDIVAPVLGNGAFTIFGVKRFPAELLVTVVSAIESLLQPQFPELKWVKEDKLKRMLSDASNRYNWNFAESDLKNLRIRRNKFAPRGFIPKDNRESIDLLFRVRFPLIKNCFSHIHSFDLIDAMVSPYSNHIIFAQKAYTEMRKAGSGQNALCGRARLSVAINSPK